MNKTVLTFAFLASMIVYYVQGAPHVDISQIDWSKLRPPPYAAAYTENGQVVRPQSAASMQNRIVGYGSEIAVPHSIPYQVGLFIDDTYFCGGSLVSGTRGTNFDFIMTAAHCLLNALYVVIVLGAHNINATEASQRVLEAYEEAITVHENFTESTVLYDIAVIRIDKQQYTAAIQPIDLAKRSDIGEKFVGKAVSTSGWGRYGTDPIFGGISDDISEELRFVNGYVDDNTICSTFYPFQIASSHICLGFLYPAFTGTCNGDSGGPLIIKDKSTGKLKQLGITSFGSGLGCGLGDSVFTSITSYLDWLERKGVLVS